MKKGRLDVRLVESGMVESRALAQRLVMAGRVRVNGQLVLKPSTNIKADAILEIEHGSQYVSRGGEKLAAALEAFEIPVKGKVCADIGASTGGFTDCLLQKGANYVYAIDVGRGILDWSLRNDPRVIVMEGTNVRYLESLPKAVDLITIDVSFISLKIVLPVAVNFLDPGNKNLAVGSEPEPGSIIALIKPQFEAGRADVKRGKGVIKDPQIHRRVVEEIIAVAEEINLSAVGLLRSPVIGPKGNQEFLIHLVRKGNRLSEKIIELDWLFTPENALPD